MNPTPSKPVHVLLTKIIKHSRDDFTPSELAAILETNEWTIVKAIRSGRIEGTSHVYGGSGVYHRYRVEKAQVVAWLWKATTGNREALRETLRALSPGLLPFLESLPELPAQAPRGSAGGVITNTRQESAKPQAPRAAAAVQPELF